MIKYRNGRRNLFARAFQFRGSVFPYAFAIALPCAVLTAVCKSVTDMGYLPVMTDILTDNTCWSGFVVLVGFLSVFRTSQAYARFWDGVTSMHQMRAEWFDACSCLIAFCRHSRATAVRVSEFQQILVRLFSMLHAVSLAEIEESRGGTVEAFTYELLDAAGLDRESIVSIKVSKAKVELVYQWIQQLIVDSLDTQVLSIPPPILSRSFQELANGMVAFHESMKIADVPFPFPYTQTCECLLMLHWVFTPVVVAQWVSTPWWGALFSFLQVFVYWCLNAIANEIEQPFGTDPNDLDSRAMQTEFNGHLLLLLESRTQRTPRLVPGLVEQLPSDTSDSKLLPARRHSFAQIWVSEKLGVSEKRVDREVSNVLAPAEKLTHEKCGSERPHFESSPRTSVHSAEGPDPPEAATDAPQPPSRVTGCSDPDAAANFQARIQTLSSTTAVVCSDEAPPSGDDLSDNPPPEPDPESLAVLLTAPMGTSSSHWSSLVNEQATDSHSHDLTVTHTWLTEV